MDYIPITENGVEKMYVTDASLPWVAFCFQYANSVEELKADLRERGFSIKEYRPSLTINFDEK